MPLDPQLKPVLEVMEAGMGSVDLWQTEPAQMRPMTNLAGPGDPTSVARVEDRTIPGPAGPIPVRLYWPEGEGPHPVIAFFHGGGFVLCGLESHDETARQLCKGSGAVLMSVDYRLAPEAKFPAAPDDCYAATEWLAGNAASLGGDPSRLAVAGDSAGGNLAAVTARRALARGGPAIVHQLLIYPVADFGHDTESYRENAEGYFLTADMMKWFRHHYLSDAENERLHPEASPLLAEDFAGLPPATVQTAEFDPLRDEGRAYAKRLSDAGVAAELIEYDGLVHGFMAWTAAVDRAADAMRDACHRLRTAFGTA